MTVKTGFGFLSSFILCFFLIFISSICNILSETLGTYLNLKLSPTLSNLIEHVIALVATLWFGMGMAGEKLPKNGTIEGTLQPSLLILVSAATISLSGVEVLVLNCLPQKLVFDSFQVYSEGLGLSLNFWSFLLICVLGPTLEELLFRGVILKNLLHKYSALVAISGSAFFFAIMHYNIVQFVAALLLGLLIGFVYVLTESLYYSIYIHVLNNILSFFLLYSGYEMKLLFGTNMLPTYKWLFYMNVLFFCICIFFIYKTPKKSA
jgi:membrane protease YdiL (CAAX protease family)